MMLNSQKGIPKGLGSRQLGEPSSRHCSPALSFLALLSWLNLKASKVVFERSHGQGHGYP